jgi:hypothetical protein
VDLSLKLLLLLSMKFGKAVHQGADINHIVNGAILQGKIVGVNVGDGELQSMDDNDFADDEAGRIEQTL